jgi:hypothetical protein
MSFLLAGGKLAQGLNTAANIRQVAARRLGNGDEATMIVRLGRIIYATEAGVILLLWYTGYRNKRVPEGETEFPIPFLSKLKASGTVDRQSSDVDVPGMLKAAGTYEVGTQAAGVADSVFAGANNIANKGTIVSIGKEAQRLGMGVGEHPAFGGVNPTVHSANSLHKRGRAIDVNGEQKGGDAVHWEDAYANMLVARYGVGQFTELIWNGPHPVSIANGHRVDPSYWGAETWAAHKNHVHIGI